MIGFYQISLIDILIGFGIAWAVRWRWPWALIAGIVLGLAFNGIHDWISYDDLFSHRQQLIIDTLAFGEWAVIFCLLRTLLAKLRQV